MHNSSPRQLFVSGTLRLHDSGLAAIDFLRHVDVTYGTGSSDDDDLFDESVSSQRVEVPESTIRLSPEQQELLQVQVNPLSSSDNFAIEKYERTVELLNGWLTPI